MGESRSRAIQGLSLEIEKYPRDLLRRFTSSTTQQAEYLTLNEDSEEIELNLGLSLGGRFGVDKNASKLIRSSSIAGPIPLTRDESTTPPLVSSPILIRTSSLPTETEEEWRKRKELQTLRRMEAKRRRSEKQRTWNENLKVDRDGDGGSLEEQQFAAVNRFSLAAPPPPSGMGSWAAAAGQMNSQGSVELQGGSSSGMSELESKAAQGSGSCGEERSPATSNQSLQERRNQEAARSSGTKTDENACRTSREEMENPPRKLDSATNKGKEIGMKDLKDMPCVFTKGDGPNGRRIEGILYKYGKGQEVRIMCVCHGSFLSPAEFVKHAGGGDVTHPLKHIVVNPSASFL